MVKRDKHLRESHIPLSTNGINFINEYDTWGMLFCYPEHFSHEFWSITEVFLNQLRTDDAQESGGCLIGNSLGQESLSRSGNPIKDDALGWFDAHFLIEFWMCKRKLDGFLRTIQRAVQRTDHRPYLDFLYLLLETTDISITLRWGFVEFHDADQWVRVVFQNTNDCLVLVVQ
jgi:hypothetical protein